MPPQPKKELDLDLDRAIPLDPAADAVKSCERCAAVIDGSYFVADGAVVCSTCADAASSVKPPGPGAKGLLRAMLFGSGAALLGTLVYFAILAITGYEIGWIAVGVGWLVGKAVHRGGYGRGGWKLQALAIGLTYLSIVASHVTMGIKEMVERVQKKQTQVAATSPVPPPVGSKTAPVSQAAAVVVLFMLVLALPFLAGFQNIIGIVIICIGLFEAWKINRRPKLDLAGPFSLKRGVEAQAAEPASA